MFKGCLGKTLFIIIIIIYKKLPKNTIYLNYLLFLTDGVNKEIKKYILIRRYNTINESLLKTNLLKCCWSQRAELEYSFKYNYELVKWWKHDPLSAAHDVCVDPPRAVPGENTWIIRTSFTASWKTNNHSSSCTQRTEHHFFYLYILCISKNSNYIMYQTCIITSRVTCDLTDCCHLIQIY